MRYGIKAIAFANGSHCPHAGQWLQSFDVDAFGGQGYAKYTSDPARALAFKDKGEVFEYWKTQSAVRPLRPDGKPNRPLTSLTISIEELPHG